MRRVLFPALLVSTGVLIYITVSNEAPVSDAIVSPANERSADPIVQAPAPPQSEPQVAAKATPSAGRTNGDAGELRGYSAEDLKPLAEQSEAFLAKRGDTPYNRLAVFSATGDRRVLEQALARFPKDPALLYVALADAPKEERAGLIERFKAADPNNPLPWIFSAAEKFEGGLADEAIAELHEAIKRPGFYTYFNERAAAVRELALQSGAGEFAAESMALFTQVLPHLQAATRSARAVSDRAWGTRELEDEAATLLFNIGRMFQTPEASRLLIGQLVGVSIEAQSLNFIGSEDNNPLPVEHATRQKELEQIKAEAKELSTVAARVFAEPALWKGYFDRFRTDGEMSALRWVNQQAPATQVPANAPNAVGAMLKN